MEETQRVKLSDLVEVWESFTGWYWFITELAFTDSCAQEGGKAQNEGSPYRSASSAEVKNRLPAENPSCAPSSTLTAQKLKGGDG